ncbi:MAG: LLM class F420-dependent oxidoreductase [Dehalococcoidia bacterium]
MKLGVTFPQAIEPDGASIAAFGREVEAAGFDYLCALDHVAGAHPDAFGGKPYFYTHESPTHEVFTLFAHLAAVTERIEFATTALILTQRQTVLVAKQAAEVQVLSGGRLRLGVVVGWNQPEAEAMGSDFATRGRRIEEQVEVLRALWTQPLVTYNGRFHRLDRVGINPLPPAPPQVWLGGGYDDRLLRRVAKYADGWLPSLSAGADFGAALSQLRSYLEAEGRDPASFGVEVRLNMARVPRDGWVDHVAAFQTLGATHLAFLPPDKLPAPEQLAMAIEAKDVLTKAGVV